MANLSMKTKLVYVLVSYNEQNDYLEQCLLSCYSARLHNPDAKIVLLTDDLTDKTLQGKRAEILKYISEKTVIDIKEKKYTATQRSRIIKTKAREFVQGDFLFIDTDTVITQPLSDADKFECNIGAVIESHVPIKKNISAYNYLKKIDRVLNWEASRDEIHFNSGVIFVKDTPETAQFYKDWNEHLMQSMAKGINIDQPAFAMANKKNNNIVEELSGEWNCQIMFGLNYIDNCKIMHTQITNVREKSIPLAEFLSKDVLKKIKIAGVIDIQTKEMIANPKKHLAKQTFILANKEVEIWESNAVRLLGKIEYNSKRMFNFINFISKCILYFDRHYIQIFRKK
jgi:cellulose synthase/poly-beta-1,6-N-acetylglucosamine synthase-like glycosyltransferase